MSLNPTRVTGPLATLLSGGPGYRSMHLYHLSEDDYDVLYETVERLHGGRLDLNDKMIVVDLPRQNNQGPTNGSGLADDGGDDGGLDGTTLLPDGAFGGGEGETVPAKVVKKSMGKYDAANWSGKAEGITMKAWATRVRDPKTGLYRRLHRGDDAVEVPLWLLKKLGLDIDMKGWVLCQLVIMPAEGHEGDVHVGRVCGVFREGGR